ncbi:Oye2p [Sugiyamaella lignohabitans]|uniref:Oye2p n=1 Tax=Sugiyamaella lignohabitans TaxID=796027 RepID=A0A167CCA8_9ASCO|nr:Oye2p [Sugiyamaella lignohabitans]ANB11499.1 Oye2p [Sugiyamaella lignohabitans]
MSRFETYPITYRARRIESRFLVMAGSVSPLFQPIKVGRATLQHRVAMAPLTRRRSPNHVPTDLVAEYYEQRASRPGTLIITEAAFIAKKAGGLSGAPGIWSQEQITAWKKVFDRIRAKQSFAFVQLWALGNRAYIPDLEEDGIKNYYVSASDVKARDDTPNPRPLTKSEIKEYIELYAQAAKNAIAAGASGVELHSANG